MKEQETETPAPTINNNNNEQIFIRDSAKRGAALGGPVHHDVVLVDAARVLGLVLAVRVGAGDGRRLAALVPDVPLHRVERLVGPPAPLAPEQALLGHRVPRQRGRPSSAEVLLVPPQRTRPLVPSPARGALVRLLLQPAPLRTYKTHILVHSTRSTSNATTLRVLMARIKASWCSICTSYR